MSTRKTGSPATPQVPEEFARLLGVRRTMTLRRIIRQSGLPPEALLDLAYDDDSRAEVDMNIVKTGSGKFIEVQGTAESQPFDRPALDALLALADQGIAELIEKQKAIVGHFLRK